MIRITIPPITVSWHDGDTSETLDAVKVWDLRLDESAPESLGFLAGIRVSDSRLLAQVDLRGTGEYRWWIFGMADELYEDKEGACATLEQAQAEVLKRLGVQSICPACNKYFQPKRAGQTYCSERCSDTTRKRNHRKKQKAESGKTGGSQ